jgi:molybdopterin-guanine dinucleotide biosynthesis protein MobB
MKYETGAAGGFRRTGEYGILFDVAGGEIPQGISPRRGIRRPGEEAAVRKPNAIAIVGNSGAGKTTLLERLIPAFKRKGVRVGVVKHDAHRFDIDHPGKDSHRLTAAGADTMMITSAEKLAMVKRHAASPPIEELLDRYFSDVDLVLVEGFRGSSLPKIEVHRKEFRRALICRGEWNDPGLAAVASDEPLDLDVPVLALNDPGAIAEFILSFPW